MSDLAAVFKREAGPVIARLVRVLGSLQAAEDAFSDACVKALERWPVLGVPQQPGAWLATVAKNRAFDVTGSAEAIRSEPLDAASELAAADGVNLDRLDSGVDDDQLRLIFTCCHPALSAQTQVALTLRTLGGLSTLEIARAFHEPEATTAQRLVRAMSKIRIAGLPYEVPAREALPARLDSVLTTIYLVFNEGYSAAEGDQLLRDDLCLEAIRLASWLHATLPDQAEVSGLLALVLLQHSRSEARVDENGDLILLEEQDRTRWNGGEIAEGTRLLEAALQLNQPGPYQLQAAIASLHAEAVRADQTDWRQIALLYDALLRWVDTPTVALNRAVAIGMAFGPREGLEALARLDATHFELTHFFDAARADFLRRAGQQAEAATAYRAALRRVRNAAERRYLERRLGEVEAQRRGTMPWFERVGDRKAM